MGAGPSPLRIVFDTNVIVSALVFQAGRLAWLRFAWRSGAVRPVVSRRTMTELLRVLAYPKFELDEGGIAELLGDFLPFTEVVDDPDVRAAIRADDPDDQPFIDLAWISGAVAIVSGGHHLLELNGLNGLRVMKPDALKSELDAARSG